MTIKLLAAYGPYPINSIVTLDAGTEAGLIAANQATSTLTGGVPYTAPRGQKQYLPVMVEVDTTNPGGGVRLADPAIESAVLRAATDVRGRGTVIWQYSGIYGPTPITGSKSPQSYVDAGDGILVEPKVGDYTEVSFPVLGSAVSVPKSYVLEMECDDWSKVSSVIYYLGVASTYATGFQRSHSPTVTTRILAPEIAGSGVRRVWGQSEDLTALGGAVAATDLVQYHKVRISALSGESPTVKLKKVIWNPADVASISITFDDGYASVITTALPLLTERGLKASMGVIATAPGYAEHFATMDQLRQWVAAGHECVPHGPLTRNGAITDYATVGEAVADMVAHRDFLLANGLADDVSANTYIWPQGMYYWGDDKRESSLRDAAAAAGFLGARAVTEQRRFNSHVIGTDYSRWTVPCIGHRQKTDEATETAYIASIIAEIDAVVAKNQSACLCFHRVNEGTGTSIDITTANFTTILNRLADHVQAGRLAVPWLSRQIAWDGYYR